MIEPRYIWTGVGDTYDITTTPQAIPVNAGGDYAYNVSIINTGDTAIRVQKVSDTADFTVAKGLVVPAGETYNSYSLTNEKTLRQIFGVVIATESGTSTAVVNFE